MTIGCKDIWLVERLCEGLPIQNLGDHVKR